MTNWQDFVAYVDHKKRLSRSVALVAVIAITAMGCATQPTSTPVANQLTPVSIAPVAPTVLLATATKPSVSSPTTAATAPAVPPSMTPVPPVTPAASATAALPSAATSASPSSSAAPVNPQSDVAATTQILNPGVVSWVHIGDLHITTADQQNYQDLQTIIAQTNQYLRNGINFAVLPGDNANDDTESEYQLIKQATDKLLVPLYAVPGDHDHKSGLSLYNKYLEPQDYYSFSAGGYHFAFLDVMAGISSDEKTWVQNDLGAATKAGLKNVIVMHSFTAATQLQDVIQQDHVILVDSGHTHYNDVANDGHAVYAAGRNTGQVTEGPVGFTMVTLDNGVVSWKFKPLGSWPFVMITSPSDKQLMIDGSQVVHGTTTIRAKIWDDKGVASATTQVDGGTAVPMQRIGATQMWSAPFDSSKVADGDHQIKVTVQGAGGNTSEDTITVTVSQSGGGQLAQKSFGPSGNDIGAYAEKGLLGNHTAGAGGPGGPAGKGGKGGPGGPRGPATVKSVSGNQITVEYKDGTTQIVTVTGSTQITKDVTGTAADLKVGETVDVHAAAGSVPASPSGGASGPATPTADGAPTTPTVSNVTADQIKIHATGAP